MAKAAPAAEEPAAVAMVAVVAEEVESAVVAMAAAVTAAEEPAGHVRRACQESSSALLAPVLVPAAHQMLIDLRIWTHMDMDHLTFHELQGLRNPSPPIDLQAEGRLGPSDASKHDVEMDWRHHLEHALQHCHVFALSAHLQLHDECRNRCMGCSHSCKCIPVFSHFLSHALIQNPFQAKAPDLN